jgi:hypothetical protein
MAKRRYLDIEDFNGAIAVMDNYLDGALADYEDGQVENDNLIVGCINTMRLIYSQCNPWLLFGLKELEERYEKAKARLKEVK